MQKIGALLDRYSCWLAILAGGLSATGFAPLNLWPLTLLCLALLMGVVANAGTGKRASLIGWLFGVGHFSIGNNWIATAFTFQAAMPEWLGWIAVVLLALYLAVYPALAASAAWWLRGRIAKIPDGVTIRFTLLFAACWIITEWLRAWVFTGFAWNPLSAILVTGPVPIAPMLKLVGTYGVSGLIIINVGLTYILVKTDKIAVKGYVRRNNGVMTKGLLSLALLIQMIFSWLSDTRPVESKPDTVLTVVQPNISQTVKHLDGYESANFARLAKHSQPRFSNPRLLLWPEAAIPWWLEDGYSPYAYRTQPFGTAVDTRKLLARLLRPDDILLTGADRFVFDKNGAVIGAHNSVFAIDKSGDILTTYDKAHLVPYGEYLALRWLLEPLGATRLVPGAIDFLPGPGPRTLNLGAGKPKVGMQICYEIIFSGQVVDRANRPDFIFNPSNDAWFGSWGSPQFLAQSRLRAIEEGLPVVRATPTGISAVIDASGRVVQSLATGKAGRIDVKLPAAKAPTLFARYGNILPLGFAALLIALAFMPLARARASR
jgi:apolipoprotein N-acyltransferase